MDDVEDLRIAVGEAAAMALGHASPDSQLRCTFRLAPTQVEVVVRVLAIEGAFPEYDSFTWTVLSALATDADVATDNSEFVVRLLVDSSLAGVEA
jgi:serine/threonine-protein kinase RsbW